MRVPFGFDVDGVIADFGNDMLARINSQLGTSYTVDQWTSWHLRDCFSVEADMLYHKLLDTPEPWDECLPYDGVVEGLGRIKERFEIHLVTAILPNYVEQRARWLERYKVPHDVYVVAESKAKVKYALENKLAGFVDDRPDTCVAMRDAGIRSIMLTQPWNSEIEGIERYTWPELEAVLLA